MELSGEPRWPRRVSAVAGGVMLGGAALNGVLLTVRPELYGDLGTWMAEVSPWELGPLTDLWAATFSAHPRVWGGVVGVGYEAGVGLLALSRDPRRRVVGLGGVALFHGGLLVMGLWVWAVPVLAVLAPSIATTARSVTRAGHRSVRSGTGGRV